MGKKSQKRFNRPGRTRKTSPNAGGHAELPAVAQTVAQLLYQADSETELASEVVPERADFESASIEPIAKENQPSKAVASVLLPKVDRAKDARIVELFHRMSRDEQQAELRRWEMFYG